MSACVRSTGGGAFDRTQDFRYFLASKPHILRVLDVSAHSFILVALNELEGAGEQRWFDILIERGARIFLDSGIFNLACTHARTRGITMDKALTLAPDDLDGFPELFSRYVETVKKYEHQLWGYTELDQGGKVHKVRTRARLEALGLKPIPVYHPLVDGWEYFDKLASTYDRIAFGNVVQADRPTRLRLLTTAWERHRRYPDLWIHFLGFSPNEWLQAWPMNSCDSSSWLSAIRWGGVVPRAHLKSLGHLPKSFQYELSSDPDGATGANRSIQMAAYSSELQLQNWHHYLNRLGELGADVYPRLEEPGP